MPTSTTGPLADFALAAGRAILDIYGTDFAVDRKADASPVTEADASAERIILDGLARVHPDIPVVAEEAVSAGQVPRTGRRFFLVDPLDGTREFVSRNGEFTVNIALIEDGAPVAGVVYAPALGVLYTGEVGIGAERSTVVADRLGPPRPIATRAAPKDGLVALGSRSHGTPETEAFLHRFPVADFAAAGSSLKFCLIAEGGADLYPRLGPTMEWDTAAGDAILRAAGGQVVAMNGTPLTYGAGRDGHRNPWFVAVGDRRLVADWRTPS